MINHQIPNTCRENLACFSNDKSFRAPTIWKPAKSQKFCSFSFNFTSKSQISYFYLLYALITVKRTQLLSVTCCQTLIFLFFGILRFELQSTLSEQTYQCFNTVLSNIHTPHSSTVPSQTNKQTFSSDFLNARIPLDNSSRDNWYFRYSKGN